MCKAPSVIDHVGHACLFDAMTEMTRGFAQLAEAACFDQDVLAKLDCCLEQGWMLKSQFSIGGSGALGCSLVAVSPRGITTEIISLDAPTSATRPFRVG